LTAAYTWSHAIDNGSGFEDSGFGFRGVNPFVPALNVGDSAFDARQRLVLGYSYQIPSLHTVASWAPNKIFGGWMFSGITTFQSGFPVNIATLQSTSLFCSTGFTFYACPDNPNQVGPVKILNPKTSNFNGQGNFYFNPASFANVPTCTFDAGGNLLNGNVCGQFGNTGRDSMVGPGYANFDTAFVKDTRITERSSLEVGLEAFNLFNHTNFLFNAPGSTLNQSSNTVVGLPSFGRILFSQPGRILQLRARITF
jgi:hypothetical protein